MIKDLFFYIESQKVKLFLLFLIYIEILEI